MRHAGVQIAAALGIGMCATAGLSGFVARAGKPASIVMDSVRFTPGDVTVTLGQSVTWRNADPFPHNVHAQDGTFASADLPPDRRWTFRPSRRGVFEYACTLHPGMKGVLRVE